MNEKAQSIFLLNTPSAFLYQQTVRDIFNTSKYFILYCLMITLATTLLLMYTYFLFVLITVNTAVVNLISYFKYNIFEPIGTYSIIDLKIQKFPMPRRVLDDQIVNAANSISNNVQGEFNFGIRKKSEYCRSTYVVVVVVVVGI